MLGRYGLYIAPICVARYRVTCGVVVVCAIGGGLGGAVLAGMGRCGLYVGRIYMARAVCATGGGGLGGAVLAGVGIGCI